MSRDEIQVGMLVRVSGMHGKSQHKSRGRIVGMLGKRVLVQLFPRHRHPVAVEVRQLAPWRAKNGQAAVLAARIGTKPLG